MVRLYKRSIDKRQRQRAYLGMSTNFASHVFVIILLRHYTITLTNVESVARKEKL